MTNGSLITNNGKKIIINRAFKSTPDYTVPSQFKVGISESTVTVSDTSLTTPVPIVGTEDVDDCEATTGWSGGTDTTVSLNSTTYKVGSGALNVYKNGTSGTVFSASKTTTSVDFTSKDLHTWLYVATLADLVASGTAVSIRFGSDASNYYQFDIAIGSLSAGWNLIKKASGDADSTTGSPTITACDYYYIEANTDLAADTVAEGDFVIDDLKVASSDDYLKSIESGYPSLDETNHESETRYQLLSTDAVGYDINTFGVFNTDGTPLLFAKDVFASESKSNTEEFLFIIKDRLV